MLLQTDATSLPKLEKPACQLPLMESRDPSDPPRTLSVANSSEIYGKAEVGFVDRAVVDLVPRRRAPWGGNP